MSLTIASILVVHFKHDAASCMPSGAGMMHSRSALLAWTQPLNLHDSCVGRSIL